MSKPRYDWNEPGRERLFWQAVADLGGLDNAKPQPLLERMRAIDEATVGNATRNNLSSHLQKHRDRARAAAGGAAAGGGIGVDVGGAATGGVPQQQQQQQQQQQYLLPATAGVAGPSNWAGAADATAARAQAAEAAAADAAALARAADAARVEAECQLLGLDMAYGGLERDLDAARTQAAAAHQELLLQQQQWRQQQEQQDQEEQERRRREDERTRRREEEIASLRQALAQADARVHELHQVWAAERAKCEALKQRQNQRERQQQQQEQQEQEQQHQQQQQGSDDDAGSAQQDQQRQQEQEQGQQQGQPIAGGKQVRTPSRAPTAEPLSASQGARSPAADLGAAALGPGGVAAEIQRVQDEACAAKRKLEQARVDDEVQDHLAVAIHRLGRCLVRLAERGASDGRCSKRPRM